MVESEGGEEEEAETGGRAASGESSHGAQQPGPSRSSRLWSAAAALCLVVAAVCWWRGDAGAAFVVATLGSLAWFLDVRARLRQEHPWDERASRDAEGEDEDEGT